MLDENKIKELSDLVKQPIKNIKQEGQMTVIEFENGKTLPLFGGSAGLEGLKNLIHECSFCGNVGTKDDPVVSLNGKDNPLICSNCTSLALKTFIQNGIEIELDITDSIEPELVDKMFDQNK